MIKRDFQKTMPNEFSDTWFEVFLDSIDPAQTDIEVDFLVRQLPLPRYERVVDLCCGSGLWCGSGFDLCCGSGHDQGSQFQEITRVSTHTSLAGTYVSMCATCRPLMAVDREFI